MWIPLVGGIGYLFFLWKMSSDGLKEKEDAEERMNKQLVELKKKLKEGGGGGGAAVPVLSAKAKE